MKREVYAKKFQREDGTKASRIKEDFKRIQRSMLFHLQNFPVFATQFSTMQCTKLLANRMHGGLLWLDREYPIHVKDIYRLTGLAEVGNAVSTKFQARVKWGKKQTEDDIYARYETE